nr:hypothetical protein [uncultured Sphingorhabdus sp.]
MTTGHAPICQIVLWRRLVSPHLLWLSPNRTAADNAATPRPALPVGALWRSE